MESIKGSTLDHPTQSQWGNILELKKFLYSAVVQTLCLSTEQDQRPPTQAPSRSWIAVNSYRLCLVVRNSAIPTDHLFYSVCCCCSACSAPSPAHFCICYKQQFFWDKKKSEVFILGHIFQLSIRPSISMVLSYKIRLLREERYLVHPLVYHEAQPWDLLFFFIDKI